MNKTHDMKKYQREWVAARPGYTTWAVMKSRCQNPKHPNYRFYGARGVKVCQRWQLYENFLADMGPPPPGLTLDRYPDKEGDYEPGNCRWATQEQQHNNKRSNRHITIDGQTKTLAQWGRAGGLSPRTLRSRIESGWPQETWLLPPADTSEAARRAGIARQQQAREQKGL